MDPILLASASPRRAALLKQVGIPFEIRASGFQEPPMKDPATVEEFALAKAMSIEEERDSPLVLGADTIVVCDGVVLGKPADGNEAFHMLSFLSGRRHSVITGLALVKGGQKATCREETRVWFRRLEDAEIRAYINTGEPLDKAGSYGVQEKGALFVQKLEGCYFNVVGLPLARLALALREFGISVWNEEEI